MKIPLLFLTFALGASRVVAQGVPPPGYTIALQGHIDNKKGAALVVDDAQSPLFGTKITALAGAMILPNEEVTLSYSKKLPGPPRRLEGGLSIVQRSYSFVLQTESGSLALPVDLDLPYFRDGPEPTDADVVPWDFWDKEHQAYDSLSAVPIAGKAGFSRVRVRAVYPEAVYVALDVAQTQGFSREKKPQPDAPAGWQKVSNEDDCLAAGPPQPRKAGKKTVFEISFTNQCEFPIQGSACDSRHGRPCRLPKPIVLEAHDARAIVVTTPMDGTPVNVGACRVTMPGGERVKLDVGLSSMPNVDTVCLVRGQ